MWMGGRCYDGDAGPGGAAVPRVPARPLRPSPITCRGLSTFSRNRHGRFRQSDIPGAPLPTVPMAPPRTWAGWASGAGSRRTSRCSASPTAPTAPSRALAAGSRAVPLSMVTGSPDGHLPCPRSDRRCCRAAPRFRGWQWYDPRQAPDRRRATELGNRLPRRPRFLSLHPSLASIPRPFAQQTCQISRQGGTNADFAWPEQLSAQLRRYVLPGSAEGPPSRLVEGFDWQALHG